MTKTTLTSNAMIIKFNFLSLNMNQIIEHNYNDNIDRISAMNKYFKSKNTNYSNKYSS